MITTMCQWFRLRGPLAAGFVLGALLFSPTAYSGNWAKLSEDEGITVWQKRLDDESGVACRGRTEYPVDILQAMAVAYKQNQATPWLPHTTIYKLIKLNGPLSMRVYLRFKSPFILVSDRDTVLDITFSRNPKKEGEFKLAFDQPKIDPVPLQEGIVRMPVFRGSWTMSTRGPGRTSVTYELFSQPGGWVPSWLVKYVNRNVPFASLTALRDQLPRFDAYADFRLLIPHLFNLEGLLPRAHPALQTPPVKGALLLQLIAKTLGAPEMADGKLRVPKTFGPE